MYYGIVHKMLNHVRMCAYDMIKHISIVQDLVHYSGCQINLSLQLTPSNAIVIVSTSFFLETIVVNQQ